MNLDKRVIGSVSGILVFALVLGMSSVSIDNGNGIDLDKYGIQSSAGVNAAITNSSNAAGVNGAVGVVDTDSVVVGQPQYLTFGYTNLGIADVSSYLNVRKKPDSESKVTGKLTRYAACEIIGEEDGYYKITSGKLEGYVSKEYIITGEEALKIAQDEARLMATVTVTALRVRQKPTTSSKTLAIINRDDDFLVVEQLDGWIKIEVDDYQGYVSADYAEVAMKLKTGNTMNELIYGHGVSQTRIDLVNYALKFLGNPYVWAGESLTKGVDCSGFTMKVYQKFGIRLPHASRQQPNYGTKISLNSIKPGDLVFYGDGSRISHVAIYIGNGQVIHASNEREGIKISNVTYRKPICCVSYLP